MILEHSDIRIMLNQKSTGRSFSTELSIDSIWCWMKISQCNVGLLYLWKICNAVYLSDKSQHKLKGCLLCRDHTYLKCFLCNLHKVITKQMYSHITTLRGQAVGQQNLKHQLTLVILPSVYPLIRTQLHTIAGRWTQNNPSCSSVHRDPIYL